MIDKCHYTLAQTHRIIYNTKSEGYCGLWIWVVMMCQCRLINCNKCIHLVGDPAHGWLCTCRGSVLMGTVWTFHSIFKFCWESKISLRNKVFFKKSGESTNRDRALVQNMQSPEFDP